MLSDAAVASCVGCMSACAFEALLSLRSSRKREKAYKVKSEEGLKVEEPRATNEAAQMKSIWYLPDCLPCARLELSLGDLPQKVKIVKSTQVDVTRGFHKEDFNFKKESTRANEGVEIPKNNLRQEVSSPTNEAKIRAIVGCPFDCLPKVAIELCMTREWAAQAKEEAVRTKAQSQLLSGLNCSSLASVLDNMSPERCDRESLRVEQKLQADLLKGLKDGSLGVSVRAGIAEGNVLDMKKRMTKIQDNLRSIKVDLLKEIAKSEGQRSTTSSDNLTLLGA